MPTSLHRCCPVCGLKENRPFLQKSDLRLVQCGRCSMVYVSPVPETYLDGSFYEDSGRPYYLSPAKLAGDYSPVRFARELRLFRSFCQNGSVLDVGCSTGAFLFQLQQRFGVAYKLCGLDVSGPALDHAESRGIPVIRGDFLSHQFPAQLDAVTFWAVLEHVADPKAFVHKAFEVLNPGGWCFILVPNLGSLAARILQARYRYILAQHINYFTLSTLSQLACPPFEQVKTTSMHFNPIVILQDWRRSATAHDQERAHLLLKTNALKQAPWLAPLRALYAAAEQLLRLLNLADNCALVARKPLEDR